MVTKEGEGYLGALSQRQEQILSQFKENINKQNDENWKYDLSQFDDYDYLRFLRARKFDLKKAIEMFTKYIKWRIEFQLYKFPEREAVRKIYPHGFHKTDKLGRPIYIERIGQLDLDVLFKHTTKERMIKYYVREYERQRLYVYPICSALAGKKIETGLTIIDLKGGSSSLLSPSVQAFVKIASGICQDYYPETLGVMFIVNCSWIIKAGWWVVKAFLDAKTVSKIHILGGSYEKELLQYVEPENLPDFLGGKCQCKPNGCLAHGEGPWKSTYDKFPKEEDVNDVVYPPLPAKWKQP